MSFPADKDAVENDVSSQWISFESEQIRRLHDTVIAAAESMKTDSAGLAETKPAWVVVQEKATGRVIGRVSAGRTAGVGERLLASMQADAKSLPAYEFRARWRLHLHRR